MLPEARIFIAGEQTLIGSALGTLLRQRGCTGLLPGGADLDLTSRAQVRRYFRTHQPQYVFLAAGMTGGIAANLQQPATLMYDNLLGSTHVIRAAWEFGVQRLLYLGSSCSYPRLCSQPMRESDLGAGPVEPTSSAYATAKIAAMELCQAHHRQYGCDFVVAIPANGFGPGDDFSDDGHVVSALIRRIHQAHHQGDPSVVVWGSGQPRRDFIFSADLAHACLLVMDQYRGPGPINLSYGQSLSIAELAQAICTVVGYRGELRFDSSRPDGAPRKELDGAQLRDLGFTQRTPLTQALQQTYQAYLASQPSSRPRSAS